MIQKFALILFGMMFLGMWNPGLGASELKAEIEELTVEPYTLSIAGASGSETLAWVEQRAGDKLLFVAHGPGFRPVEVVKFTGDTGITVDNLVLAPSGRFLAFRNGPSSSPNGRTPNPASLVDGMENALWLAGTDGSAPVQLAQNGGSPLFSPEGEKLAFVRDGEVHLADLSSGDLQEIKASIHKAFTDMGGIGDLTWSPDSSALAFVSYRSTHSLVGVYRIGAERLVWQEPSIAMDMSIGWSVDGKQLAFLRLAGRAYTDVRDVMKPHKFEIWVTDPVSGEGHAVYTSPGPDASRQTGFPLHWLESGQILFLSERDGFSHLYLVAPESGDVRQISEGQCEIEQVHLNENANTIATSGNCYDTAYRDISTWTATSARWSRMSPERTVGTNPVFLGQSGKIAFRSGSFDRSQAPLIASPDGAFKTLATAPGNSGLFTEPEFIRFKSEDGTLISGTLFKPRGRKGNETVPGVVYVHGGPIRQMMPAWHMNRYYAYAYAANQQLANRGVAVLAVNYRTGTGFGRDFRVVDGYGPHGARELQDVIAAGLYLQGLDYVDSSRIGIYGGSIGGHLAANALGRRSDLFIAGVAWHGLYDYRQWKKGTKHANRFNSPWGISEDNLDQAYESSALAHVNTWKSPVLLVSGDDDRNVGFEETVTLYRALKDSGVSVEAMVLPNEIHGFLRHESWTRVISRTNEFLLNHLGE